MRFQVPQNIDLEDKIVGPLTMFQFIYLLVGGIVIYLSYTYFPTWLFIIIAIPGGLLALSLAFVKIQDQPFSRFMKSLFLYLLKPKVRIWHKAQVAEPDILITTQTPKPTNQPIPLKKIPKGELQKLAQVLDKGGKPAQPPK